MTKEETQEPVVRPKIGFRRKLLLLTISIVGSLLLSAKGIMAKLLYAHGLTFDALTGIRAIVALPLFWRVAGWC